MTMKQTQKTDAKKTYSEKLKDPRWQKKRLEILSRDDFKCCHCFVESKPLHVHHSYYTKGADPWDYYNSSLVTLCDDCHERTEAINEEIRKRTGDGSWKQAVVMNFLKATDSDYPFTKTSISLGVDKFNHFICNFGRAMKASDQSDEAMIRELTELSKSSLIEMIHYLTSSINELEGINIKSKKETI